MFVHLAAHSAFSLQEGLPLPEELARLAAADGMPALGLADHRLLTGAVPFVQACQREGVRPLLGLEVDLEAGPLVLYAMDLEGWSGLCRISSLLALRPDPLLPCSLDQLAPHASHLLALCPPASEASLRTLGSLADLFPGRLHLAVQEPSDLLPLSDLGRRLKLPLVVAPPVYTLSPAQAPLQRTLSAIRLNTPLSRLPPAAAAPPGSHFLTTGEVESRFQGARAALAATQEIASRCAFDLPLGEPHLPTVPLPPGLTASQHLRQKAEVGLVRLYGRLTPALQARLEGELETIARMGFEPVFLIVEEVLDFARRSGVPFSSRGSAASSLVAHCLGITSPDPLRLDLYFERFLNPARRTPPDIDTDLCSRRRDLVLQHIFDLYGPDRAAMVATINHFRPRSALGEAAKAHGMAPARVRELVATLPHAFFTRQQEGDEEQDQPPTSPFADLRSLHRSPEFQRIFEDAEALLRLPRHLSVHPGGLVVAPGLLTDLVPLMRSGSKGITTTQFDLSAVEALGLVKIDLLGIRGLTVLGDVAEFIQVSVPSQPPNLVEVLESIPGADPETSTRLETGATIGCFQIESPGMRATLREIRARTEDDLMAALALYRPGPLTGGLKEAFVRRFKGLEPVEHIHPALAPILQESHGVILYQEQVLRIAHDLAGFSLAEADLLRRAMSHFDPGKQMQQLQQKFVLEAQARRGLSPEVAGRLWEMMAAFAGYGFPKAHAASYARVAWRSAWCKTHFPAEFMAAVLANWGGYYSQRVYLGEARRMGLLVRPPHVNWSGRNFVVASPAPGEKALFMGLDQVRDLSSRTINRILALRPFRSLDDFLSRTDPRREEARNLARLGALEGFGPIPALLRRLEQGGWQAGQPSLFGLEPAGGGEPDWTPSQKAAAQQELLGLSLEAHPLELAAARLAAQGVVTTLEAALRPGQRLAVAGLRQSGHRSLTARGEPMMFMTLEDLSGLLDVVLFPPVYRQARSFIHTTAPLLITGVVEIDPSRGEPLLRAEKVERLS